MNPHDRLANPVSADRATVLSDSCQPPWAQPLPGASYWVPWNATEKQLENRAATALRSRPVVVRLSEAGRVNRSRATGPPPVSNACLGTTPNLDHGSAVAIYLGRRLVVSRQFRCQPGAPGQR